MEIPMIEFSLRDPMHILVPRLLEQLVAADQMRPDFRLQAALIVAEVAAGSVWPERDGGGLRASMDGVTNLLNQLTMSEEQRKRLEGYRRVLRNYLHHLPLPEGCEAAPFHVTMARVVHRLYEGFGSEGAERFGHGTYSYLADLVNGANWPLRNEAEREVALAVVSDLQGLSLMDTDQSMDAPVGEVGEFAFLSTAATRLSALVDAAAADDIEEDEVEETVDVIIPEIEDDGSLVITDLTMPIE
jgi:hypothetical protein